MPLLDDGRGLLDLLRLSVRPRSVSHSRSTTSRSSFRRLCLMLLGNTCKKGTHPESGAAGVGLLEGHDKHVSSKLLSKWWISLVNSTFASTEE